MNSKKQKATGITRTQDTRYYDALNDRANIMIRPTMEVRSILGYAIAPCIIALIKGFVNDTNTPVYWAYWTMIQDLLTVASGKTPALTTRLKYVADLIASYKPKDIKFKAGTITYSWQGLDNVSVSPDLMVRGYHTNFFVADGTILGNFEVYSSPTTPTSIEEATPIYSNVMNQAANNQQIELSFGEHPPGPFRRDVSAYASNLSYFGEGNSASSGAFSSVELEVPFFCRMLGCNTSYSQSALRCARNLEVTSGDSTSLFGLPFTPGYKEDYFRSPVPVIYCYLDLDEVVYYVQTWMSSAIQKYVTNSNGQNIQLDLVQPFGYSPNHFRLFIRQVVLAYFSATQVASQFMTYSTAPGAFEPLRCGATTYPSSKIDYQIKLPLLLVENLRMLQSAVFRYKTAKYDKARNVVNFVPVWGIYKTTLDNPINIGMTAYESASGGGLAPVNTNFCVGSSTVEPNVIDGYDGPGNSCNLNSAIFSTMAIEWNMRVAGLSNVVGSTATLAGGSNGSLLYFTRYSAFKQGNLSLKGIPSIIAKTIPSEMIKQVEIVRKGVTRTNSREQPKEYEAMFVPSDFNLYTQESTAYSSYFPITTTVQQVLSSFIVPTIFIEAGTAPSQAQHRTSTMESYIVNLDNSTTTNLGITSRAYSLTAVASGQASGLAAGSNIDELTSVIKKNASENMGGFIGDLLVSLAPLAQLLPF